MLSSCHLAIVGGIAWKDADKPYKG
jgi:hypothetical protein